MSAPGREDILPWYRQFWPWFLIALPGSVVIAAFATLYIAAHHADDLVVDEYYKDGLAINVQLKKQTAAQNRGMSARITVSGGDIVVDTQGIQNYAQLRLQLSHPLEAERDFVIKLRKTDQDRYSGTLTLGVAARWHWILDGGADSDWRLDGSLEADNFSRDAAG